MFGWPGRNKISKVDREAGSAKFAKRLSTDPFKRDETSAAHAAGRTDVDKELFTEQVQVERKTFAFNLRENPRGRFLRITENVGGRRDTIIIPATGLEDIMAMLGRTIKAYKDAGPVEE
jgi:hypothetical protein